MIVLVWLFSDYKIVPRDIINMIDLIPRYFSYL